MTKKKNILRAIIIVLLIGISFDQYMKHTWDNHIVEYGERKYIAFDSNNHSRALSGEEIEALSSVYKKTFQIVKQGMWYRWDDKRFLKRTERYMRDGSWASERPNREIEVTNFVIGDDSIRVRVASGGYILTKCEPFDKSTNANITYKMNDGERLRVEINVRVYENLLQFFFCKK